MLLACKARETAIRSLLLIRLSFLEASHMGTFALIRSAASISAATALLAACGALSLSPSKGQGDEQPPIGSPAFTKANDDEVRKFPAPSPIVRAASGDLLYVARPLPEVVDVY